MNISKLGVAKFIATGIVSLGAGKIVAGVIKNNVAPPSSLIDRVTIAAAGWVIGGLVQAAAKKHVEEIIDGAAESAKSFVQKIKEQSKLNNINQGLSTFEEEGLNRDNFKLESKDGKNVWVRKNDDDGLKIDENNGWSSEDGGAWYFRENGKITRKMERNEHGTWEQVLVP